MVSKESYTLALSRLGETGVEPYWHRPEFGLPEPDEKVVQQAAGQLGISQEELHGMSGFQLEGLLFRAQRERLFPKTTEIIKVGAVEGEK